MGGTSGAASTRLLRSTPRANLAMSSRTASILHRRCDPAAGEITVARAAHEESVCHRRMTHDAQCHRRQQQFRQSWMPGGDKQWNNIFGGKFSKASQLVSTTGPIRCGSRTASRSWQMAPPVSLPTSVTSFGRAPRGESLTIQRDAGRREVRIGRHRRHVAAERPVDEIRADPLECRPVWSAPTLSHSRLSTRNPSTKTTGGDVDSVGPVFRYSMVPAGMVIDGTDVEASDRAPGVEVAHHRHAGIVRARRSASHE